MTEPSHFLLDERLVSDCIFIKRIGRIQILLFNNSLLPWFILVPETDVKELYLLDAELRKNLLALQDDFSRFIMEKFTCDKLNIAAIGNIVSQMHIHIVGRYKDDYAWPGVVWGVSKSKPYEEKEVVNIKNDLFSYFELLSIKND
ncbi:MAG: HIT family protein [Deltaproteobacteria bacterium]|nr:HIT family protein [Deltaproteobacteria bacterium]